MNALKRRGRRWRIALIVVVVVLVGFRLALAPIVRSILQGQLNQQLRAPVKVGSVGLSLLGGRVTVRDLSVGQPEGFGEGSLLTLKSLRASVGLRSLTGSPIVVRQVVLEDPSLVLVTSADKKTNLEALLPPAPASTAGGPGAETPAPTETPPPAETPAEKEESATAILLQRVQVAGGHVRYIDRSAGATPLDVTVADLDLDARDLYLGRPAEGTEPTPGSVLLTGRIEQPDKEAAPFGLIAKVGPVAGAVPPVVAAVRLVGFELATVGPLVPPGVKQALGGEGLDASVDAAASPALLDIRTLLVSSGGGRLALSVGGTPDAPKVSGSEALMGVVTRIGGQLGQVGGRMVGTGQEVVGTALDTTTALAKGAGNTVRSFAGGLFGGVRAAARGDLQGAAKGLGNTVTDTAKSAGGMVTGTVGTATEGIGSAGSKAAGLKAMGEWRKAIRERWEKSWQEAREGVAKTPLPSAAPAPASPEPASQEDAGDA